MSKVSIKKYAKICKAKAVKTIYWRIQQGYIKAERINGGLYIDTEKYPPKIAKVGRRRLPDVIK